MTYTAFQNTEAEQACLGAALQDARSADLVADMNTADFTQPAHSIIHQAIKQLVRAHTPIDTVTIHTALMNANLIDKIGGPTYLMQLINQTPTVANVKNYIRIVHDCASRRQLKSIGHAMIEDTADGTCAVNEISEKALYGIRNLFTDTSNLVTLADSIKQTYDLLGDKSSLDHVVPTGIPQIDSRLGGGIERGNLLIIGARPSVGKSILGLTICLHAVRHGKKVLFVTLEMTQDEVNKRILSNETLVPMDEIISRNITNADWMKMGSSLPKIASYQMTYSDHVSTIDDLRRDAFTMYDAGGLDMICVDYLQLLRGSRSYANRQEEVADISRSLKALALELHIPIIALCQLSRLEKVGGKRLEPSMSNARESGAIEQDADIFIILHDPLLAELQSESEKQLYSNLKANEKTLLLINVDKNRQGRKGVFFIAFDGNHMRFQTIDKGP